MLKSRMEALHEHNDRLGALIADIQIKRVSQVSRAPLSLPVATVKLGKL